MAARGSTGPGPVARPRLLLLAGLLAAADAGASTIVAAEAWFDSDPGPGAGLPLAVAPGDAISLGAALPSAGLEPGLHRIGLRLLSEDGVWSGATVRPLVVRDPSPPVEAQQVEAAEAWFGADPGPGAGLPLPLTPGSEAALAAELAEAADLAPGLHELRLRVRDSLGRWSGPANRVLVVRGPLAAPESLAVAAAEAWFGDDPGPGAGVPLEVEPGDAVGLADSLATAAGLAPGLHELRLRLRDSLGSWSGPVTRVFAVRLPDEPPGPETIVAAEVWFDEDPGSGAGQALALEPGADASLLAELAAGDLPPGLHRIGLRLQDADGRWSRTDSRLFRVIQPVATSEQQVLFAAEFFVGEDPGHGAAVPIDWPLDGAWDDTLETLSAVLEGLPVGFHRLGLRFRDSWGTWSTTRAADFLVGPWLSIAPGFPPTLSWTGDLGNDLVHVHRADAPAGPWTEIATTHGPEYVDEAGQLDVGMRWYRVTQEPGARRSGFRLPGPGSGEVTVTCRTVAAAGDGGRRPGAGVEARSRPRLAEDPER